MRQRERENKYDREHKGKARKELRGGKQGKQMIGGERGRERQNNIWDGEAWKRGEDGTYKKGRKGNVMEGRRREGSRREGRRREER